MGLNSRCGSNGGVESPYQFGVMFFPDKRASFDESFRVLTPADTYLFVLWDDYANMPNSPAWIAAQTVGDMLRRDPHTLVSPPYFDEPAHSCRPEGGGISGREARSDCANSKSGFSMGCSGDHRARTRCCAPPSPRRTRRVSARRPRPSSKSCSPGSAKDRSKGRRRGRSSPQQSRNSKC